MNLRGEDVRPMTFDPHAFHHIPCNQSIRCQTIVYSPLFHRHLNSVGMMRLKCLHRRWFRTPPIHLWHIRNLPEIGSIFAERG